VPPAGAEDRGEEPAHGLPALVLERDRRHRHEHVVGQKTDQSLEISIFVRADEPFHDRRLVR
jgi:hypothetical protein